MKADRPWRTIEYDGCFEYSQRRVICDPYLVGEMVRPLRMEGERVLVEMHDGENRWCKCRPLARKRPPLPAADVPDEVWQGLESREKPFG